MKSIANVAVALVLAGCAANPSMPLDPGSVAAKSHPTQLVSFTGSTGLGLSVPELVGIYAPAYPLSAQPARECIAWSNPLEGVSGPKTIELHVPTVKRESQVNASVYLDRYEPGKCNWRLREVDAVVVAPPGGTGDNG